MSLMARCTSSLVIDTLCDQANGENLAVAALHCDFFAQEEQTTTNMMGAILKQVVGRGDEVGQGLRTGGDGRYFRGGYCQNCA